MAIDERQLQALIDRSSISEVQIRYATGVDMRDWAMYRSCFANEIETDFSSAVGTKPQRMKADDWVLLPFPAANRDPEAFDRAGEVVLDREVNKHAAFGLGIHRCVGSHLARMELRIALDLAAGLVRDERRTAAIQVPIHVD